jgi:hypothetical protein
MPRHLLLGIMITAASSGVSYADGKIKVLPDAISPNGAYAIAWGDDKTEGIPTEVPFDDEKWDEQMAEDLNISNYLFSTQSHRILATIPEFDYFRGPNWHANRRDLFIAWTPDSGHALAIFDGRFGSESITWIDSSSHKVTTVLESLQSAFHRVLEKKEGAPYRKNRESYDSRFSNPAFTSPTTFTVYAEAAVPKSVDDPVYSYDLTFKVSGKASFTLINDKASDATEGQQSDAETRLNHAYQRLRNKLDAGARETLKQEELRWLKQREAITDEGSAARFVEHRIDELKARANQR